MQGTIDGPVEHFEPEPERILNWDGNYVLPTILPDLPCFDCSNPSGRWYALPLREGGGFLCRQCAENRE